jgi:hypothetical protein
VVAWTLLLAKKGGICFNRKLFGDNHSHFPHLFQNTNMSNQKNKYAPVRKQRPRKVGTFTKPKVATRKKIQALNRKDKKALQRRRHHPKISSDHAAPSYS